MKKTVLIALICVISLVLMLIAVGCIRPIVPGSSFDIVYPADGAVVPAEFSVLGVAARWSFGIEVYPPLFLAPSKSHVALPPSTVELSVDGAPYARSSGGNHHVFRLALPEGDHVLELMTPFGTRKITVRVAADPPVRFEPFYETAEYMAAVDGLKEALYEYMRTSPVFSFSNDMSTYRFQKIFLAGSGAFILFGAMKEQYLAACDVAYVPRIGVNITAADISAAPVVFAWDGAAWPRPIRAVSEVGGGDRFNLVVLDDEQLTLFSVFPDGSARRTAFSLSAVSPGLAESVRTTSLTYLVAKADRDTLFLSLDAYQADGPPGDFGILIKNDVAKMVDPAAEDTGGVTPDGDLIVPYPVSYVMPFDTATTDGRTKTTVCLPLPEVGEGFSFTGGSVHRADEFTPEHPRFDISPPVPCAACTDSYMPPYWTMIDDVTFGPDVLKTTLGGREQYFIIKR